VGGEGDRDSGIVPETDDDSEADLLCCLLKYPVWSRLCEESPEWGAWKNEDFIPADEEDGELVPFVGGLGGRS
jgi:hypothetical protein